MQGATPKEQCRKTINGSLRYERKEHGHTQKSIAEAIDVSEKTVNSWEGIVGSIPLEDAWRIADVYGISLDQLAGRPVPEVA